MGNLTVLRFDAQLEGRVFFDQVLVVNLNLVEHILEALNISSSLSPARILSVDIHQVI